MPQPKWKTIESSDYHRILKDETGNYIEEMEIADEYGDGKFIVYRIVLDKLKLVKSEDKTYLVPEGYDKSYPHPVSEYVEWFDKDLGDIARSSGTSKRELIDALTSSSAKDRAMAYEAIGRYNGFENFDSDPLIITEEQLNKRWD